MDLSQVTWPRQIRVLKLIPVSNQLKIVNPGLHTTFQGRFVR